MIDRKAALALDAIDPLARKRTEFKIPTGLIYLDGNSLGILPDGVSDRVAAVINGEWGRDLIGSWAGAGWIHLPRRVGDLIAPLVGACKGEIAVGDSTSVNLFKCLSAALKLRPERKVIVTEAENFPTDNYITQGVAELLGGYEIRYAGPNQDPRTLIDQSVAAVLLTHVNYRSAAIHPMQAINRSAHQAGALTIWDLSHSTGAVPVTLRDCEADFAVGCTYKYLNGGPGAPAFVYVAADLVNRVRQPLSGWMGHRRPFAFVADYEPGETIQRFVCGTPQIISLVALQQSLSVWDSVDMSVVRRKSISLTNLFMDLVEQECRGHGLTIVTPREDELRGSHVSISCDYGYPVMRALAERRVIGDFRAPDLMRFGFTPLYLSHSEVYDAAMILKEILDCGIWREPRFSVMSEVT